MLIEQGIARFLGYALICFAYHVSGQPWVIGLAVVMTMAVLAPIAGSSCIPVVTTAEVFSGKRGLPDAGIELMIMVAAAFVSWYIYDCWKRANPGAAAQAKVDSLFTK